MMPAVVVADVVLGFKLGAGVALLGLERPPVWVPAGSSVDWLELGADATYRIESRCDCGHWGDDHAGAWLESTEGAHCRPGCSCVDFESAPVRPADGAWDR